MTRKKKAAPVIADHARDRELLRLVERAPEDAGVILVYADWRGIL